MQLQRFTCYSLMLDTLVLLLSSLFDLQPQHQPIEGMMYDWHKGGVQSVCMRT